ncbi:MAG: peptidylprolyl isomerase [Bradymonadia bacterium]
MFNERGYFFIILLCMFFVVGCSDKGIAQSAVDGKGGTKPKADKSTAKQPGNSTTNATKTQKSPTATKTAQAKMKASAVSSSDGKAPDSVAGITPDKAVEKAPATYTVRLETTKGNIDIDIQREWAPLGADRFYNLVKLGYYTDVAFFRVIPRFMAQVGLSGTPKLNTIWRSARIQDDPVKQSNTRGMVTFATSGPNSRTTQFFINFRNNARLDGMGFAPFGKVKDTSLAVLDSLHDGYGEGAPRGRGPSQGTIQREGNSYLKKSFPRLDYIKRALVLK